MVSVQDRLEAFNKSYHELVEQATFEKVQWIYQDIVTDDHLAMLKILFTRFADEIKLQSGITQLFPGLHWQGLHFIFDMCKSAGSREGPFSLPAGSDVELRLENILAGRPEGWELGDDVTLLAGRDMVLGGATEYQDDIDYLLDLHEREKENGSGREVGGVSGDAGPWDGYGDPQTAYSPPKRSSEDQGSARPDTQEIEETPSSDMDLDTTQDTMDIDSQPSTIKMESPGKMESPEKMEGSPTISPQPDSAVQTVETGIFDGYENERTHSNGVDTATTQDMDVVSTPSTIKRDSTEETKTPSTIDHESKSNLYSDSTVSTPIQNEATASADPAEDDPFKNMDGDVLSDGVVNTRPRKRTELHEQKITERNKIPIDDRVLGPARPPKVHPPDSLRIFSTEENKDFIQNPTFQKIQMLCGKECIPDDKFETLRGFYEFKTFTSGRCRNVKVTHLRRVFPNLGDNDIERIFAMCQRIKETIWEREQPETGAMARHYRPGRPYKANDKNEDEEHFHEATLKKVEDATFEKIQKEYGRELITDDVKYSLRNLASQDRLRELIPGLGEEHLRVLGAKCFQARKKVLAVNELPSLFNIRTTFSIGYEGIDHMKSTIGAAAGGVTMQKLRDHSAFSDMDARTLSELCWSIIRFDVQEEANIAFQSKAKNKKEQRGREREVDRGKEKEWRNGWQRKKESTERGRNRVRWEVHMSY